LPVAGQLVFNWVQRAIVLGYLQEIPASAADFIEPGLAKQALAAGFKWTLSPDHLAEGSKSVTSSQPMSL
jgi:hypothetical protein